MFKKFEGLIAIVLSIVLSYFVYVLTDKFNPHDNLKFKSPDSWFEDKKPKDTSPKTQEKKK
jgi:hypothetical protein